jgi:hypothetical protein
MDVKWQGKVPLTRKFCSPDIPISGKLFYLINKELSGLFRKKSFFIFGTLVALAEALQLKSELSQKTH